MGPGTPQCALRPDRIRRLSAPTSTGIRDKNFFLSHGNSTVARFEPGDRWGIVGRGPSARPLFTYSATILFASRSQTSDRYTGSADGHFPHFRRQPTGDQGWQDKGTSWV